MLLLLSALTAWLGSRRLFTALQWTLSMTAESQKNAEEARWHRGEVQRVLKNLDEAYVRLEHTNQALLLAREAGRMPIHKTPTNLADVVRESADIVRGLVEARGLACEVSLPDELPLLNLDRTLAWHEAAGCATGRSRLFDQAGDARGLNRIVGALEPTDP